MKISCLFCGEDLVYDKISIGAIAPCPRCGAMITFTTDLSGISALLAEAVFDTALVSAEQRERLAVRIQPDIDTLEGGDVVSMVNLAVAWDPAEMLTTVQTAKILGLTRERVSHLCQDGAFPGAMRLEPSRPKLYSRGPWRIPRRDVGDRMRRNT